MKKRGWLIILCILTALCFSCKGQTNISEEKEEKIYLTIKYYSDHGYQIPKQVTVEYGSILTVETLPELYNYDNSYVFRGWYTNKNFNENSRVQIGYKITENLVLYAKWEKTITYYTVKFDTRKYGYIFGSQSQTVREKEYVSEPMLIRYDEYSDYIFDGWYTDEECTNLFDFYTPITSNITLYAKWKLNMALVKISLADSSDIAISKSMENSLITLTVSSNENNNYIWLIDGKIQQEETADNLIIDTKNLTRGTHTVSVIVILSDGSHKSAMVYITVEE